MIAIVTYILIFTLPLIFFPFYYNSIYIDELKWFWALVIALPTVLIIIGRDIQKLRTQSDLDKACVCFLGVALLATFFSFRPLISGYTLLAYVSLYCAYLIGRAIKERQKAHTLIAVGVASASVAALFFLIQSVRYEFWDSGVDPIMRIWAPFANINNLAAFLIFCLPLAFMLYLYAETPVKKIFYFGCLVVIMAALLLTRTRAAWLSATVGLLLCSILSFVYLPRVKVQRWLPIIIGIALIASAVLLYKPHIIGSRLSSFTDVQDRSVVHRIAMWRTARDMARNYVVTGIGLGMYELVHPHFQAPHIAEAHGIEALAVEPHNDLLLAVTERGIGGLITVLALFVLANMAAFRTLRERKMEYARKETVVMLISACNIVFINGLFHSSLQYPTVAFFFFLALGILREGPSRAEFRGRLSVMKIVSISIVAAAVIGIAARPLVGNFYFQQAFLARKQGQLESALTLYEQAEEWKAYDYRIPLNRGNILRERGNVPEAVSSYQSALAIHPYSPNLHNSIAVLYASQNVDVAAREHFQRAITLNPHFFGAYVNYGIFLLNRGEYAQAIRHFEIAGYLNPTDVLPHLYLAQLYKALGRKKQLAEQQMVLRKIMQEQKLTLQLRQKIKNVII